MPTAANLPVLGDGSDASEGAGGDEDDGHCRGEVRVDGEGDVALGEEGEEGAVPQVSPGRGRGHQDSAELGVISNFSDHQSISPPLSR